jgi:hypothetical protein
MNQSLFKSIFIFILPFYYGCITINPVITQPAQVSTPNSNSLKIDTPSIKVATLYNAKPTSTTAVNVQFEGSSKDLTAEKLSSPAISTNKTQLFTKSATLNKKADNPKNDIVRVYTNKDGKRKTPFIYFLKTDSTSQKNISSDCQTSFQTFTCLSSTFMTADYASQSQYIYPGAIYKLSDFENGNFDDVTDNRKDLTLSIDIPAVKNSTFVNVSKPNLITLREAVRSIYENFDDQKSGNLDFRYRITEANNTIERQLKTTAGGELSFGVFGGAKSDNTSEEETKSNHRYLTVDIIKDMFTINSLPNNSYLSTNSQDTLVVVNSVTYGMRLLANIDITGMETKNTTTSNNSGGFLAANGHFNLNSLSQTLKGNTTINCYVVGGPADGKSSFTLEEFQKNIDDIVSGTNFSNARPIEYSLSDTSGNIWSIQSTVTNIVQRKCKTAPAITNFEYTFLTGDDDKDDEDHVSITFTLLPANKIIYENKDVRPSKGKDNDPTWHNGSLVPAIDEGTAISNAILKSDPSAKQIMVTVKTSNGDHWHMGYDFKLVMDDGSKILLRREEPIYNFGNGGGGLGQSKSWVFDIPWNGVAGVTPNNMQRVGNLRRRRI